MNLTHADIQAILKIIDDSPYDELRLDNAGFSLYLKRTAEGWSEERRTLKSPAPLEDSSVSTAASTGEARHAQVPEAPAGEAGLVDVRAPIVGTFYRAPQPGAAPFVDIGSEVNHDTVIGIIEVMKLMSSIPAQAHGTIRELLVQDAQFVEKGQLLMRVKPAQ
ncbi:MAG: acetyl-CoA carboxylase biotin carboxyl carrier protein [Gammaproteobacteria bacterium]